MLADAGVCATAEASKGERVGIRVLRAPASRVELERIFVYPRVIVAGQHLDLYASALHYGYIFDVSVGCGLPEEYARRRTIHSGGLLKAPVKVLDISKLVVVNF